MNVPIIFCYIQLHLYSVNFLPFVFILLYYYVLTYDFITFNNVTVNKHTYMLNSESVKLQSRISFSEAVDLAELMVLIIPTYTGRVPASPAMEVS